MTTTLKYFRRWKTLTECNKLHNLLLDDCETVNWSNFDEVSDLLLRDKLFFKNWSKLNQLVCAEGAIHTRTIMTTTMIVFQPDAVLEAKDEQTIDGLIMVQDARKLWNWFARRKRGRESRSYWSTYRVLCENFMISFKKWKTEDSAALLAPFYELYHELMMLAPRLALEDQTSLLQQIQKIETGVRQIGTPFVDEMKRYHELRASASSRSNASPEEVLKEQVSAQMKEAYWSHLTALLSANDWSPIAGLLNDCKAYLCAIAPSRKSQYDEYIDVEFISQQITLHVYSSDQIYNLIMYIIDQISQLDSLQEVSNNEKWRQTVHEQFRQRLSLSLIVVVFFKRAFEKMERIHSLMATLLRQPTK